MANTWDLCLFLLAPHIAKFEDALAKGVRVSSRSINDDLKLAAALYYKLGEKHHPEWSAFVGPNLKKKVPFPHNQSISAVLFVRTEAASYAYVFGIGGRSLLDREAYVPDFGKKVVLSIVNPNEVRSIDLRAMREQPFLTRQQATRATGIRSFGVDTLQDHLRAVTGKPKTEYEALAKRITGADSLTFRATITFQEIAERADAFYEAYKSGDYKKVEDFRWVDQVSLVRNQKKIDNLDQLMLTRIKAGQFDFGPPEVVDWHLAPTFAFKADAVDANRLEHLSPGDLTTQAGAENLQGITVQKLKDLKIYCFFQNGATWKERWRAYDCIEMDLVDQGKQYAFAGGHWSEVHSDFLAETDSYVAEIRQLMPALLDPPIEHAANTKGDHVDEGKYIKWLTDNNAELAKVHQCGKEVKFGKHSVEFCDVYYKAKYFIHLKVWRSSQGFSALAMQAANAAEFLMQKKFAADCATLLKGINESFAEALPPEFNPRDYSIVMGLIRKENGDIPFFSKLTLRRAAERIKGRGFRPVYVVIPVLWAVHHTRR